MKDLNQFIKTTIREFINEQKMLLKEGKQTGVLYHNTNIENAKSILKTNNLRISNKDLNSLIDYRTFRDDNVIISPFGPFLKDKTKIKPYISFTRNKMYKRTNDNVQFILDGNKLSQNYKINPYSQFGGREADEMEERVYRDITNLDKYIIKIILPFNELELESLLKEKNIIYQIK
jgi:hypothetical protein